MFATEYLKWALLAFFGRKKPEKVQERIFDIDLREVRTRDEFYREFAKHLPIERNHARFWYSLWSILIYLPSGCVLRFQGWVGFEQRMPRYASRIRRLIRESQRWKAGKCYNVEYA